MAATTLSVVESKNEYSEMFYLIWLDSTSNDDRQTEDKLRSINNQLEIFQDVSKCLKYIEQLSDKDRLVLIVSGRLGKEIAPFINNVDKVLSIYVYCYEKESNEEWSSEYSKVKFLFL